jgi:hypothetical protein
MKQKYLRHTAFLLCVLSLLVPYLAAGQQPQSPQRQTQPKQFELTVDSIMRGPRLVGYQPTGVYWSQDSQRVYFRWKQADEPRLKEPSLYVVNRDGTGLRRLSDDEARQAPPAGGELSKDKSMTVFTEDGDIFIYDHRKGERRQITRTTDVEANAHFTADQKQIYFTRQNNLFLIALDGGSLVQLTDIRIAGAGAEQTVAGARGAGGGGQRQGGQGAAAQGQVGATGEGQQRGTDSQEYLKKEERQLLEAVRERAEQREEQETKRKERDKRKPLNLPAAQSVGSLALSPDGKYVIAAIADQGTGAKNAIVPNYVTESAYTEDIPNRTKVGDAQGRTRWVIISVETGESRNVDHGQRQIKREAQPQTTTAANQRTDSNTTESGRPRASQPRRTPNRSKDKLVGRAGAPHDSNYRLTETCNCPSCSGRKMVRTRC